MNYENWKNKAQGFQTVDVRHIQGSFFEGLKKRAEALEVGEGLHIIQTFEPHPLYAVMEGLGYEHHTEQRSEAEFHVWFCRVEKKEGDSSAPFKPLALLNYPMIDEKLGQIAVDFWETTWQSEKRVLPYETRLLLSLTNAVGAGRMRQAARELVKAYIEQMCDALRISTKTGYKLLHEGKIPAMKIGRSYRIPKAHLFTYLQICGQHCRAENRQC